MSVDQAHLSPVVERARGRSRSGWLLALAAGVFVGAIAFELLPTAAARLGWSAAPWVALGFAGMLLAGGSLRGGLDRRFAWAGTAGIWLHSLLEGMAAAAGFEVGAAFGAFITLVLIMHLIPEAAALGALSAGSGAPGRSATLRIAGTVSMAVAGFLIARLVFPDLHPSQLAEALAVAGGGFCYLAVATVHRSVTESPSNYWWILFGAAWIALLHI